jgi:hypothetical protein
VANSSAWIGRRASGITEIWKRSKRAQVLRSRKSARSQDDNGLGNKKGGLIGRLLFLPSIFRIAIWREATGNFLENIFGVDSGSCEDL